ncbi:MAG: AAA family ATPase [Methyloprofundus sp.]|nr:AAA family ATPase [Methyloprofundus sp.]
MQTKYLYIMGSASGVGKTMICEGLLSQLLVNGYQPEQLAYIKPMTQCIDKQAVTIFCENEHIAHCSIGSLVFKKGFTKEFIEGRGKNSVLLLQDILAKIAMISEHKAIVIVDGIGGVSTGSVVGVSNADIARSLAAPVLLIGQPGIGSAIDDTLLAMNFLQQQGIQNIALVYNKIKPVELANTKHYVSMRLTELLPTIPVLDFIGNHTKLDSKNKHQSAANIYQWLSSEII